MGSMHSTPPCQSATHAATSMVIVTLQKRLSTSESSRFPRCTFFVPKAFRSPSAAKMVVEKAPPSKKAPRRCQKCVLETAAAPTLATAPASFCCGATKKGTPPALTICTTPTPAAPPPMTGLCARGSSAGLGHGACKPLNESTGSAARASISPARRPDGRLSVNPAAELHASSRRRGGEALITPPQVIEPWPTRSPRAGLFALAGGLTCACWALGLCCRPLPRAARHPGRHAAGTAGRVPRSDVHCAVPCPRSALPVYRSAEKRRAGHDRSARWHSKNPRARAPRRPILRCCGSVPRVKPLRAFRDAAGAAAAPPPSSHGTERPTSTRPRSEERTYLPSAGPKRPGAESQSTNGERPSLRL